MGVSQNLFIVLRGIVMSRKDYIVVADILVSQIQLGYVKKKDINNAIRVASNFLCRTGNFDYSRFENYIMERI